MKRFFSCVFFIVLLSHSIESRADLCSATKNKGEWKYLYENDSFQIRQKLIAKILKNNDVKHVIEIGGFCTPICKYYPEISYINIDPFLDNNDPSCKKEQLIKLSFEDVDFDTIDTKEPFALVFLGIWLENLKKPIEQSEFLLKALAKAKLVFFEAIPDYPEKAPIDVIKKMAIKAGLTEQFSGVIHVNKLVKKTPRYMRQFYYFKR